MQAKPNVHRPSSILQMMKNFSSQKISEAKNLRVFISTYKTSSSYTQLLGLARQAYKVHCRFIKCRICVVQSKTRHYNHTCTRTYVNLHVKGDHRVLLYLHPICSSMYSESHACRGGLVASASRCSENDGTPDSDPVLYSILIAPSNCYQKQKSELTS